MKPSPARMALRVPDADDRRTCQQCASLSGGRCTSPHRSVHADWPRDIPFRCRGFSAKGGV